MTKQITFTNVINVDDTFKPEPSSKHLPEWYRQTESYLGGKKAPVGEGKITTTI